MDKIIIIIVTIVTHPRLLCAVSADGGLQVCSKNACSFLRDYKNKRFNCDVKDIWIRTHEAKMLSTHKDHSQLRYYRKIAPSEESARIGIAIGAVMGVLAAITLISILIDWQIKRGVKVGTIMETHCRTTEEAGRTGSSLEIGVIREPPPVYRQELKEMGHPWTVSAYN